MKSEWIPIMKETKKVKLTPWGYFNHFSAIIFFLITLIVTIVVIVKKEIHGSLLEYINENLFISAFLVLQFILITFLIRLQIKRLKFKIIDIRIKINDFKEIVKGTAEERKWDIQVEEENFIIAYTYFNWTSSEGGMITVIREEDSVMINSICGPDSKPFSSLGENKKNIQTFLKYLIQVKDGIEYTPYVKVYKRKNEWAFHRVLFRIFAYPFCLLLVGIGFYTIFWEGIIGGIVFFAPAYLYLYTDLMVILKKDRDASP